MRTPAGPTADTRGFPQGLKDTGVVFLTRMFGVLAGVVTQAGLAWFLAPEGRGEFAVCSTFAVLLGVVFGVGFDRAVQYRRIAGSITRAEATGLALLTALVTSIVAIVCGWYAVDLPLDIFEKASKSQFRLALLIVPAVSAQIALSLVMEGERLFRECAWVAVAHAFANVTLILMLVGALEQGVAGAILAWVLASSVAIWLQLRSLCVRPAVPQLLRQHELMSYALRYYPARLGNAVNSEIGLIVLAMLATTSEIGLFTAASLLTSKLVLVPQTLATVILPRVGQVYGGRPELVAQACRFSSAFLALGLAALAMVAPVLVPLMLSPAFSEATMLVWLLSLGTWARGVALPVSSYFIGVNRPGMVSALTLLELLASIVFMSWLYNWHGLRGAAIGATVACLFAGAARIAAFARVTQYPPSKIWLPGSADLRHILENIDRFLGREAPTRRFHYSLNSADADERSTRKTVLLPDRVVKLQHSVQTALEAAKTRAGDKLGTTTGLFRVPEILTEDAEAGRLEFRRIPGIIPLWHWLKSADGRRHGDEAVGRAACVLAVVHRGLQLQSDDARLAPLAWRHQGLPDCWLHGDYTAFNLLRSPVDGSLWVTDWATSDWIDPWMTRGNPAIDVTWFTASLFFQSHFGLRRIRGRQRLAERFVREYCRHYGCESQDLVTVMLHIAGYLRKRRPKWAIRVRTLRQESLAEPAFLEFCRRLERITAAEVSVSGVGR